MAEETITTEDEAKATLEEEFETLALGVEGTSNVNVPKVDYVSPYEVDEEGNKTVKDDQLLDDKDYKLSTTNADGTPRTGSTAKTINTTNEDGTSSIDVDSPKSEDREDGTAKGSVGSIDSNFETDAEGNPVLNEDGTKKLKVGGMDAASISKGTAEEPFEGYIDETIMDKIQGTVAIDSKSLADNVISVNDDGTVKVDEQSTVKFQIGELMTSLKEGKPMPAWAAPQIRKVNAIMASRGMGASSMAAAAILQSIMESGMPIAMADASTYATMELNNLNNKQATTLANAAVYAAMDKENLNARLQGAVTNANALLSIDTTNLTAEQETNALNYSALTQALFKDTAAENLRIQMNAKNEVQVDQFYVELDSQVETANANRQVGVDQFNAGEDNAMSQFNDSMKDAREKFDTSMGFAIDQSNAVWKRELNTADTALQNETNRINAQNAFSMTATAINALWQKYRDNASWNFNKSESQLQRLHELGVMAMEFANSKETYTQTQMDDLSLGLANWLTDWVGD